MTEISGQSLQQRLDTLLQEHGVVGASLAVLHNGQVEVAASGQLNVDTGIEATADSLFQIGSISKAFTATLIMQLVDKGRLDLDQPVKTYLPSFGLANPVAAHTITVRQLLAHTSGMEGDFFPEDDPFGPSIASFVERCRLLPQTAPVGKHFSYANSAYTIAGRIIEVLTGRPWHLAVAEQILQPLGLKHSTANPAEMLRYRAAMGHMPNPQAPGSHCLAPMCFPPLSHAPAGSALSMSAGDLLAFANMHLAGGCAPDGSRLLSEAAVTNMQQSQVSLPEFSPRGVTDWGLGWFLGGQQGQEIFGHDGATIGQASYLRVLPAQGLALVLLSNSDSGALFEQLEKELLEQLAGVSLAQTPEPAEAPADCQRFVGRYESLSALTTVVEEDGKLYADVESKLMPGMVDRQPLQAIADDCFVAKSQRTPVPMTVHFLGGEDSGQAEYFFSGFRLSRRVV